MADIPGYTPKRTPRADTPRDNPTAFWPVILTTISLIAILTWQVTVANEVKEHVVQLRDQQVKLVDQSKRMQAGLQKFARDLIELSKSDADAKAIVDKYGISVTSPTPGAPAAPAAPAATP